MPRELLDFATPSSVCVCVGVASPGICPSRVGATISVCSVVVSPCPACSFMWVWACCGSFAHTDKMGFLDALNEGHPSPLIGLGYPGLRRLGYSRVEEAPTQKLGARGRNVGELHQ